MSVTKPHITKWNASTEKPWQCKGGGVTYLGKSPVDAYRAWAVFMSEMLAYVDRQQAESLKRWL